MAKCVMTFLILLNTSELMTSNEYSRRMLPIPLEEVMDFIATGAHQARNDPNMRNIQDMVDFNLKHADLEFPEGM